MEIIKKTDKEMFEKISSGEKTFEIRIEDDCRFKEGDVLVLKEVDDNHKFTGRELRRKIGFILRTKKCKYWDKDKINKFGYTVLSLKKV